MKYILALDQGTTSSRAILFDRGGQIVAVAQKEFEQIFPKPGWVEHNPNEIWSSQISVAAEVLTRAGITSRDVAGLGITNQRETAIVWDRTTGRPVMNAIVWQDRRTAGICDKLRDAGRERVIRDKNGLLIDAYFSGSKIKWMLDNVPDAQAKAEAGELAFGTVDSWLIYRMTEGKLHITDVTNACRTMLFNIHTGDWDDELLEILEVPRAMMPEVRPSSQMYAETAVDMLKHPIPIAGIAGDQQAALFGQMCIERGMAKNTYGTGCFLLQNTGTEPIPSDHKLLTTVAWQIGEQIEYAMEGSIFIAGAVVQWLRDGLKLIRSAPEIETLARSEPDNGGVYLVPAFAGLGAPHWDAYARGTMVGLSRGSTAGHIARAALESIAFQVADVLEAMQNDTGLAVEQFRADGGAAANNLLMQCQADLIGAPVVRPQVTETTALGAAYLAGLAVGYWKNRDEIDQQWQIERTFEPQMERSRAAELRDNWRRAVERAKGWDRE